MKSALLFFLPLGIILTILAFMIFCHVKEGFEEQTDEQKLQSIYHTFTDRLCPALAAVRKELEQDPDFDPKTFPSFQCPPVKDLATLSPTIGKEIVNTVYYLVRTLENVNQKLTEAVQASCRTEGFETKSTAPTAPKVLTEKMRNEIYRQRLASILQETSTPEVIESLVRVDTLYKKLRNIQENPESVKTAC